MKTLEQFEIEYKFAQREFFKSVITRRNTEQWANQYKLASTLYHERKYADTELVDRLRNSGGLGV